MWLCIVMGVFLGRVWFDLVSLVLFENISFVSISVCVCVWFLVSLCVMSS